MQEDFIFTEAKRQAAPQLIGISGKSGSGKTYSALLLARGLVGPEGRIGVADSEGKRALIYADDPDIGGFVHYDFHAPYSSDRYTALVRSAAASGISALIIDSASHEHEDIGGMLDFADQEEKRLGSNRRVTQQKWVKPKQAHKRFVNAIASSPMHVILCIREKTIIDVDVKPAKEINLPVCDRDLMFEFTLSFRLIPETHATQYLKVPLPLQQSVRDGEPITIEHGRLLAGEAKVGERQDPTYDKWKLDLAESAQLGTQTLKTAWEALYRNNAEKMKPTLDHLLKNEMPRLKHEARAVDELDDQPEEESQEHGRAEDFGA